MTEFRRPNVLAIPSDCVSSLFAQRRFWSEAGRVTEVLDAIESQGRFHPRDVAEQTDSLKQIIAFALVRSGDEFLCLRRSRRENRAELRLRHTLLFGGHVDDSEQGSSDPLVECLVRELNEELGLTLRVVPQLLGVVTDPTTPVGRLHLGVIFQVHLDTNALPVGLGLDQSDFTNPGSRKQYDFVPWHALSEQARTIRTLDPWSELVVYSDSFQDSLSSQSRSPLPPKQLQLVL